MALLGVLHVDGVGISLLLLRKIGFMIMVQLACFKHFLFGELSYLAFSRAFLL